MYDILLLIMALVMMIVIAAIRYFTVKSKDLEKNDRAMMMIILIKINEVN